MATWLSEDERERAARFRLPEYRDRFIAARGVLRDVLSRYVERHPREIAFRYNACGKPALAEGIGSELRFNLSHCEDRMLIAVTRGCDVGVDLERIYPVPGAERIMRRFFSTSELQAVGRLPRDAHDKAFLTCWVGKEAILKGTGRGLSAPLLKVELPVPLSEHPTAVDGIGSVSSASWWLYSLDVGPRDVAALAVREKRLRVVLRRWRWRTHD